MNQGVRPVVVGILLAGAVASFATEPIDRRALVTRHNPSLQRLDPESPLSVGNGEFAFTADVTGLQTFASAYEETIPLGTLAQWGWHTAPNPMRWSMDTFRHEEFAASGRQVGYADIPGDRRTPEIEWLRANPHRLHLGQVAFRLLKGDGARAGSTDLASIEQTLDLWTGVLQSRFELEGETVRVETICHPELDVLAVRVESRLLRQGRIGDRAAFPVWHRPAGRRRLDASPTRTRPPCANRAREPPPFRRQLDDDTYQVGARWTPGGALERVSKHELVFNAPAGAEALELTLAFAAGPQRNLSADLRRDPRGGSPALGPVLEHGRGDRPLAQQGPAMARAGAAHRAVAVLDRDPVRGKRASPGDRPHLQQLGGQVPPGDALVARGPLRALGPRSPAGAKPRVLREDPAPRPSHGASAKATSGRAGPR